MSSASTVASAMPLSASQASLAVTNVSWILSDCALSSAAVQSQDYERAAAPSRVSS